MIEGLRVLPWYQDARREDPLLMLNCETCLVDNSPAVRAAMGCGYLPTQEGFRRTASSHQLAPECQWCPVYTTNLPDVIDVSYANAQCGEGGVSNLRDACGGEAPPESLLHLRVQLVSAHGDFMAKKHKPKEKP